MGKVSNPIPIFLDARGLLLDGGYIYLGAKDADPETTPVDAFWDVDLTIPAEQPLRTIGGLLVNGVNPSYVFIAESDYSMRIEDNDHAQISYSPSVYSDVAGLQPLNANLTAISALVTTAYGRNLLTLANQAALQAAVGISTFTGGNVTSNIVRQGAGTHLYWNDSALTSGRVFVTDEGAADPTSLPGDWWIELEP